MLPTAHIAPNSNSLIKKTQRSVKANADCYTLRPPGEPLQTLRPKRTSSTKTNTSYGTNPFTLIKNCDELRIACATLQQSEAIGLDCETTALDPYQGEIRLTQLSNDHHTYIIDHQHYYGASGYEPLKQLLENTKPYTISHNSKFEQKFIAHQFGIQVNGIFDTMLASQLINYDQKSHKLSAVARTYLGIEVDKTLQNSNWSGELSESQLQYAARDSQVLLPLRQTLRRRLFELNLIRAAQIEFEAVPTVAAIELAGVYLDIDRWKEQLSVVTAEHKILADELQSMLIDGAPQVNFFGPTQINLDAHHQILAALKLLKVPLDRSTRNNILLPLANQFPVVAKLLEYRPTAKALSSYGENWFSAISPVTGRVHPDFTQIGAPTGRFSCTDPNVQQVPHAIGYRRCFRAPQGRKLCIVDYSQIELRILAEFSQDPGFLSAFQSGADLHKTTASQVFNVPLNQVTPQQRDFAKRLNFGVVYGIGAARFANMTGMSLSEAEGTLRRYFETYRVLDTYLLDISAQAILDHETRTASGRLTRYKFDPKNRQQISATKRQARNAPIQGTGADILKRALRLLGEELKGTSAQIVNIIHDEIVVEVDPDQAQEIGQRVSAKMIEAAEEYITSLPVLAEPTIADEWVK